MKNQKEGVFDAICAVLAEVGKTIVEGTQVVLETKERKSVIAIVAHGLANGLITLSTEAQTKYNTEDKLRKDYVPGLVSNWLRKDLRLNGGTKYETKKPGSRTGQGDEVLKNLRRLHAILDDEEQKQKVQVEIDARVEQIKKEKLAKAAPDMSKIPAELREQLGLTDDECEPKPEHAAFDKLS